MDIAMTPPPDLATLRLADFAPHLNTGFEIHQPDGSLVKATLAEAVANGIVPPAGGLKGSDGQDLKTRDGGGFTLQFVTPENSIPKQGVYQLKHPVLGTLEVFLVPNGPVLPRGFGYNAVFG
jgi:uncharacterized protein DUF6916